MELEVDLGPGYIVLYGDPVPLFGPCLLWPWSPISATVELLSVTLVVYWERCLVIPY